MSNEELCSPGFIARLKARDNQAFADLVGFMGPRLCSALEIDLNLSHEDAEDVVYESLFKIWERGLSFDPNGSAKFTTWLRTTVINAGIDFIRKQTIGFNARAKVAAAEADDSGASTLYDTQSHIDWIRKQNDPAENSPSKIVRELDALTRILETFPEKDRDLLRLRLISSYEEIARIENEPVGRLRTRHMRVLRRLKEALLKELCIYE